MTSVTVDGKQILDTSRLTDILADGIRRTDLNQIIKNVDNPQEVMRLISASDAWKDGTDRFLSATSFGFENGNIISPDEIKRHLKYYLFPRLIDIGQMRKLAYHRIKGYEFNSTITVDEAIYDCGLPPSKIALATKILTTLGNKIDTGPSSSEIMSYPTTNCIIPEAVMALLGYTESSLTYKKPNLSMKLKGNVYPDTSKLALGNAVKNAKASNNPDKIPLIYYKSLGDKLIAFFYLLFCLSTRVELICLFTCDIFVALYCILFEKPFVYDENEKEYKITGVFHWQPIEANWNNLVTNEKMTLLRDYAELIGLLNAAKNSQEFVISGIDIPIQNDGDTAIFFDFLLVQFNQAKVYVEGFNDFTRDGYNSLKGWKPMKIISLNRDRVYVLVRTKRRICVAKGFEYRGSVYDLYQKFVPKKGGMIPGGIEAAAKKREERERIERERIEREREERERIEREREIERIEREEREREEREREAAEREAAERERGEVGIVAEDPTWLAERLLEGDTLVDQDIYQIRENLNPLNVTGEGVTELIDVVNNLFIRVDVIFNIIRDQIPEFDISQLFENEMITADETSIDLPNINGFTYNYGSIFDEVTYYLYVEPDYTDDYLFNIIKFIIKERNPDLIKKMDDIRIDEYVDITQEKTPMKVDRVAPFISPAELTPVRRTLPQISSPVGFSLSPPSTGDPSTPLKTPPDKGQVSPGSQTQKPPFKEGGRSSKKRKYKKNRKTQRRSTKKGRSKKVKRTRNKNKSKRR
jgi:hypothetical protein